MQRAKLIATFLLAFIFPVMIVSAQDKGGTVSVDAITKIFAIAGTVIGAFIGYMQIVMSNKIAGLEAKVNVTISLVEDKFMETLDKESTVLEKKFHDGVKELENKMATKQDISQMEKLVSVQLENIKLQLQLAATTLLKSQNENSK